MNGATDWIPEPFCHPKVRCGIIRRRAKTRYCYFLKTPQSQKSRPQSWPVPAAFGPCSGRAVPVQPARTALCIRLNALFPARMAEIS